MTASQKIKKTHGNTGKSNAKKSEPKDSYIHIRVTKAYKEKLIMKAKEDGMSLSVWIQSRTAL